MAILGRLGDLIIGFLMTCSDNRVTAYIAQSTTLQENTFKKREIQEKLRAAWNTTHRCRLSITDRISVLPAILKQEHCLLNYRCESSGNLNQRVTDPQKCCANWGASFFDTFKTLMVVNTMMGLDCLMDLRDNFNDEESVTPEFDHKNSLKQPQIEPLCG